MAGQIGVVLAALLPLGARAQAVAEPVQVGSVPADPALDVPDPADAARAASAIIDAHCTDVAGGGATASAEALVLVGPVLAQVSRSYDATAAPFLLYWRGILTACIGQEDRATSDLGAFVELAEDRPEYTDQVRDSRRRLGRMGARPARPAPDPRSTVLLVVGGAATAGGLALGLGSYERGSALFPGLGTTAGWDADIDAYRAAHAGEGIGVAVAGIGSAMLTAGLVKVLVDADQTRRGRR